ncbi:MAG: Hsp70 family protein [Planctomycetaceae bacterium]|nr:Hsp70 family protein [Planctomycetaceae bacterium]
MPNEEQSDRRTQQPPIGIDLGTTYSVLAYLDETGRPTTLTNGLGDILTPSAILVDRHDVIVGREALKASTVEPASYAECFKRDVGTFVYRREVHGIQVPPEVLSAFVLEQLKRDAEQRLGPIKQVVITVPAFFDESRRKATQDAGRLAGLEVLDIINEPTAAAVAYGHQHGFLRRDSAGELAECDPMTVLVYDLGGGTFDVTILEIKGTQFRAIATDGDVQLGGKDFDERIVEHLAEQFIRQHGADPRSDPHDAAQLWLDAQEVKHTLSQRSSTHVVVFHAGLRTRVEITRQQFDEMTRDLLERTETTTSIVVKEAGLNWSQIDRVLLVGGSSRMPMVAEMLERVTGKTPDRSASPDEAIAHGAALYAGMLMQQSIDGRATTCQLINVNSHSLGVIGLDTNTHERVNAILIPKNTPLPHRSRWIFQTAKTNQRSVKVAVLEGESHRPEECIPLGECVVRELPPGLPKGSKVEVIYSYAANGRIAVSARVPETRQSAHVEIKRNNSHDLEDLDTWRARLLGKDEKPAAGSGTEAAIPVKKSQRGNLLRRLDSLHIKIGYAAVGKETPEALQRTQASAQKATAAYRAAKTAFNHTAAACLKSKSSDEKVQSSSLLAAAKVRLDQYRTQANFACLVLGRECVQAGFLPAEAADLLKEVTALRKALGQ